LQEKSSTIHNKKSFKKLMSLHFSTAANSYDKYAIMQHAVAKSLHQLVASYVVKDVAVIADLGCGTGRETQLLATCYDQATVIGIDIATKMLQKASNTPFKNIKWCRGDIEDLPLKANCINLLFSNLALQWCDLATVLNKSYSTLTLGGYFIFSTLCAGSLCELSNSWMSINEANRVNNYFSKDQLVKVISNSPFVIEDILYDRYTSFYPDVISLLQSLKYQGVNTIYRTAGKLTSRSNLQRLIQSYSELQTDRGIPLSYQVAKVVLKKVN
jgi:malonyl-CoA O-methyltransferase